MLKYQRPQRKTDPPAGSQDSVEEHRVQDRDIGDEEAAEQPGPPRMRSMYLQGMERKRHPLMTVGCYASDRRWRHPTLISFNSSPADSIELHGS